MSTQDHEGRPGSRRRPGRIRPGLERLESRSLMTGGIQNVPEPFQTGGIVSSGGHLWVIAYGDTGPTALDELSTDGTVLASYPVPTYDIGGLAAGPDGRIWFTEYQSGAVGVFDPATGSFAEYSLPAGDFSPRGLVAGPDGSMWLSVDQDVSRPEYTQAPSAIVRVAPDGTSSTYVVPDGFSVTSMTAGPDGAFWFTATGGLVGTEVGRLTVDGAFSTIELTAGVGGARDITAGPDGDLWFLSTSYDDFSITTSVVRMTVDGTIAGQFIIPVQGVGYDLSDPNLNPDQGSAGEFRASLPLVIEFDAGDLTAASDGNLYYDVGDNLYQLTSSGTITAIPLASHYDVARGLTDGPDGDLWFTQTRPFGGPAGELDRLDLGGPVTKVKPSQSPISTPIVPSSPYVGPTEPILPGPTIGPIAGSKVASSTATTSPASPWTAAASSDPGSEAEYLTIPASLYTPPLPAASPALAATPVVKVARLGPATPIVSPLLD